MSASLILAFVSDTAKMPNATIATAIVTFSIAAKYERTCFITFPFVVKGMCPQPMFPTSELYIRKSGRGELHCCTNAHIPKLVRKRGVGDVN